jgi:hypothetical protein
MTRVGTMNTSVESWIDTYFESLAKANTETGQSEGLDLKRSNFPKALYRYRSLARLANTLEELRDGYVFLSKPADFNDPYDSALSASYEQVRKQVLEKFGPEYGYGYDPNAESKFALQLIQTRLSFGVTTRTSTQESASSFPAPPCCRAQNFSNCCTRCDTRKSSRTPFSFSGRRKSTSIRFGWTSCPFWRLVTNQKSGDTKMNGG